MDVTIELAIYGPEELEHSITYDWTITTNSTEEDSINSLNALAASESGNSIMVNEAYVGEGD